MGRLQRPLIGVRHFQVFLMFLGFFTGYMQRVNLSVGILAMTDPTANPNYATLNYTTFEKGVLSSVMYVGYMISGVPAGIWSNKYGPVVLISLVGGIVSGLVSAAFPYVAIYFGFIAACIMRILIGLTQGIFNPAISAHISKWVVPQERETFGWVWSGGHLSMVLTIPLGGILATSSAGWPSIFYVPAALTIGWGLLCFAYGVRSPSEHKWISSQEKSFLEENMPATITHATALNVPWSQILKSIPLWALLAAQFAGNWGLVTLITLTPTYIQGVYGYDVRQSSFLAVLPYVMMFIFSFVFSFLGGKVLKRCGVNFSRKFWTSVGLGGSAVPFFVLAFVNLNITFAMVALVVACILHSAAYIGYLTNHLDLSSNFCGITHGLGNVIPNIASVTAPTVAGYIVKDESSSEDWQMVYLICALVQIAGNLSFLFFGSTSTQPWDSRQRHENTIK